LTVDRASAEDAQRGHSQLQKYCAISKEMIFYLEMYGYFAAIIASHDRKSINLRAQSMLKNYKKSTFLLK
jgi:hypothetical protein